jgi:DNA-binding LytR/AlgR family response regulator
MRIAICEDNPKEKERLEAAIKDWAQARNTQADIVYYTSAEAFLMAWPEMSFDLAFLDIQMKNMSGIELAETIRRTDKNILLVFVTSFTQYVLKGYDVAALHYLIKPLSAAKLLPVLDKAQMIWRSRQSDFIMVSDGNGQIKLPYDSINYIAMISHTAVIHTNDKTYDLRKTAAELIEILPPHFVRCHRSYIVNLFKADCVYKDSLILSDGTKLAISRNSSKQVGDAFLRLHTE